MSEQVQSVKHRHIAETLAREIRGGSPANGAKLPGEHALAVRFGVSRNTVRQALAELTKRGMIATESGKGSFVTFDDRPLDQRLGWARALAGQGVTTTTRTVRMDLIRDADLAGRLGLDDDEFLALDRVRAIVDGPAISLECARVPAVGPLRDAPRDGLIGDSLTATLHAAGRYADHGEERIDILALDDEQAVLLGRTPGDTFLHTQRISRTINGELVEHTDSLLDPARFQIRLQFGDSSDCRNSSDSRNSNDSRYGNDSGTAMTAIGTDAASRARGALYGLAIGDALGMPTQALPREQIVARYGERLTGFVAGGADQPIAPNMPAGSITDDTEQAVLVGRLLVAGDGHIAPATLAAELLAWEAGMAARGSLDLLGPSTKRAVAAVEAGVPVEQTGRYGDTNGAAMRIAPVGIAVRGDDPGVLVDRVVEASAVSHNTGVALAGASAVAAAISAGLDGAGTAPATRRAIGAARLGAARGYWIAGADIATRIEWATDLVTGLPPAAAAERIYRLVGTSVASTESVPAAFAVLAVYPDDPWQAVLLAASLGGDCDTIAAMAGAIAGAVHGLDSFPKAAVDTVRDVNNLDLDRLAGQLLELREAGRTVRSTKV